MAENTGPRRRWRSSFWVAAVVLVALGAWLVTGSGTRRGDLASADPDGARACRVLDGWLRGDPTEAAFDVSKRAGPYAYAARTPAIRASVTGIADVPRSGGAGYEFDGYPIVDLRQLHAACRGAGVDLPPYPG
jgi:hypothetical protein